MHLLRVFPLVVSVVLGACNCSKHVANSPNESFRASESAAEPGETPGDPPELIGNSWRLVRGRYEELSGGYGVTVPAGWEFRDGDSLREEGPWAPVALVLAPRDAPMDVTILRRYETSAERAAVSVAQEFVEAGVELVGESSIRVDGEPVPTVLGELAGMVSQVARWCDGPMCTRITVSYSRASADEAQSVLRETDLIVRELTASERGDLREALANNQDPGRLVDGSLVFEDLQLHDSDNGIAFTLPGEGPWTVYLGEAAQRRSNMRHLLARFDHVETGLVIRYSFNRVQGNESTEAWHAQIIQAAGTPVAEPRPVQLGPLSALSSDVVQNGFRRRVVSARFEDRSAQIVFSQLEERFLEQEPLMEAFVASFRAL